MDNVRQLSELVNGNVEHLNVFEDCTGGAALKKRYLQVRVQKAVEARTILTEDEALRNLEARRAELVQKLRDGEQRIQTTRATLERRFTSSAAIAGLVKVKDDICDLAKSTDEALQTLAKEEPLVSVKNSCNGLEKSFQSVDRAKIREQFPTIFKCSEILKAVCHCLEEIQHQALDIGRNVSDQNETLAQYKNIQYVALELAKILTVLKSGGTREEIECRVEALKTSTECDYLNTEEEHLNLDCSTNTTSPTSESLTMDVEGEHLDLAHLGSIKSNMEELSAKMASLSNHTNQILEELKQTKFEYSTLLSTLPRAIDEARSKILAVPTQKGPVIINIRDTSSLDAVILRHALAQPLPDLHPFLESVDKTEAALLERMRQTKLNVDRCRDNFVDRSTKFSAECRALERLQDPDFKALFP